jgi:FkbM family methyltransferase
MAPTDIPFLSKILGRSVIIDVVDIGANPIDEDPPYKPLLARGAARLVGFEPNRQGLERLNRKKGRYETYLGHAVADGKRHTLHCCQAPGMTSLLEPNAELYRYFNGFPQWGTVVRTEEVDTVRLDDVPEVAAMDYLKIDIQGGELMVFENATRLLADCLVIHTEVEFLPLYVGQPLFSEVEQFLRGRGYVLHRFWPAPRTRTLHPMMVENNVYRGLSQVMDADAVFVRDFTRLDSLDSAQLLRLAVVLHDVYRSLDLVLQLLMEHDRREGGTLAARYMGQKV